ncbi:MAG: YceI family protein [Armatimonadetes bacterium]|nr:YceI family protein [Armatimonadota bacterium]
MNYRLFAVLLACPVAVVAGVLVRSELIEFDFKDPKGVNAMTFLIDSTLEPIHGTATGISGKVFFDPERPEAAHGKIVVATSSLKVTHATMTGHLHGQRWLDAERHPTIEFEIKKVKPKPSEGDSSAIAADVTGDFSMHGVTKELTIPVTATYLKDALGRRVRGMQGDLVVIRCQFKLSRKAFGIGEGMPEMSVGDAIELRVAIVGIAPASGQ